MSYHKGFSLVELMVAMVIGLIIILGAGQLFLTVFQTNRQVDTLGEKQAAVNFAVESLLRDVRRADWGKTSPKPDDGSVSTLTVTVPNRGDCSGGEEVEKIYSLSSREVGNETRFFLSVGCDGGSAQEIVGGFTADGFDVTAEGDYGVLITFTLLPTDEDTGSPDSLAFRAVNRSAALAD